MKVIYMGTPDFAVYALKSIIDAGHEVVACFTQPDKAKGRSKALVPTPVKACATEHGIPVYQPERLREEENVNLIRQISPDVIVVAAYGQILPVSILEIPKYGCINIHASLLPKYRGAAPIEWSIINGEEITGVTTMYMAKGLDTGDMIHKIEVPIDPEDTGETLHDKLAKEGAKLILKTLDALLDGSATREAQDDSKSSYASMLNKEMGQIDFGKSATEIERLVRGLIPWPCAYTRIDGKNVKLYKVTVKKLDDKIKQDLLNKSDNLTFAPGEIIEVTKKSFTIACKEDAITVNKLQVEGKKPMDAVAYLNGNKLVPSMMAG